MRRIAISVLSVFVVFPALGDARLPVVNLAAGGVSARAAFGAAPAPVSASVAPVADTPKISLDAVVADAGDAIVRSAVSQPSSYSVPADTGEHIVASDVLSPRRPSGDLWARVDSGADTPLRLPLPSEFSVIKSDAILPEESLNTAAPARSTAIASVTDTAPRANVSATEPLSELDAQIAQLNAAAAARNTLSATDVKPTPAPRAVVARNVVARPVAAPQVARADTSAKSVAPDTVTDTASDVTVSRMVVPMDDDVVVRAVQQHAASPRIATVRNDMTSMSPSELRRAFRKTFLSENKHLSTFQIDDRFDVASDMTENAMGFTSARDLSETGDNIRSLEIKISFRNGDSALSRSNYETLASYAAVVLQNPTRAVQVSIPQGVISNYDDRKLAARRLAIVEQVLRDNGIAEQRILPVLSQRDEDGLVLRMISLDQYETLTKQQRDIFGDTISKKTYKSMSW